MQDDVATALAEFTELWKKGELDSARNKPGSVLSSLIPADMPVAKLPGRAVLNSSSQLETVDASAALTFIDSY